MLQHLSVFLVAWVLPDFHQIPEFFRPDSAKDIILQEYLQMQVLFGSILVFWILMDR